MEDYKETGRHHERSLSINMTKFEGLYDIRDAKEEDKHFILATFLRGMYYGDSWFSFIPKQIFMTNYKPVAEALVNGNKTAIKIACLKEDPDVILGYSILSADYLTIHFCFVKAAWRQKGIARSLLPKYPTAVTHLTRLGRDLLPKLENTIFNPFAL